MVLGVLFLLTSLGGNAIAAQDPRTPPASSLARAEATFRALDVDGDGRLGETELEHLAGVDATRIAMEDHDGDGTLDRNEFLVLERHMLQKSGLRPAADLEAETARIQVLRRARGVLSARLAADPALRMQPGGAPAVQRRVFERPLEGCAPGVRSAFEAVEREVLSGRTGARELVLFRAACDDAGLRDDRLRRALEELSSETKAGGRRTIARLEALRTAIAGARATESKPRPASRIGVARAERASTCSALPGATDADLARLRALMSPGAERPGALETALARLEDARTSPSFDLEVRMLRAVLHGVVASVPAALGDRVVDQAAPGARARMPAPKR